MTNKKKRGKESVNKNKITRLFLFIGIDYDDTKKGVKLNMSKKKYLIKIHSNVFHGFVFHFLFLYCVQVGTRIPSRINSLKKIRHNLFLFFFPRTSKCVTKPSSKIRFLIYPVEPAFLLFFRLCKSRISIFSLSFFCVLQNRFSEEETPQLNGMI